MDKCKILTNEVLKGLLKAEPRQIGKRILDSVKGFGLPLNVLEDTEVVNDVEVHVKEGDLWYCLDGIVHFFLGGVLVEPWVVKRDVSGNAIELKAKQMSGARHIVFRTGDWLWIPPGEPHLHECKNSARLLIIKIPAR